MAGRKRYSVMRDPVHGDVYLTHEEMRVLDTPQMQRLRGVRQLGTAYLVYPGALHTRFDHSVGSVHMTQRMIESVNLSFELDPAATIAISDEEARVIRIAALVHDITHIPFGHNIEDQGGLFSRHDSAYRFERMFARGSEIGRVLDDLGVRDDVLSILVSGGPTEPGRQAIPAYWSQLISGTIAADILDYLARDAYFTGLHLQVDPRVTSYFKIDRASGNLYIDLAKHDLLREDILSEIVRMLEARYYFSERVYYHHAKVAAGALIARAVELAVSAGGIAEDDLYDQTDASILTLLENSATSASPEVRARILSLTERFQQRRLPKRVCVFPRHGNEAVQEQLVSRFFSTDGEDERSATEERIRDLARFATGSEFDLIVYCPAKRMQLKEARIHVRWPKQDSLRPLSDYSERVPRLADLEQSYRNLWKFYVFGDIADPRALAKVQEIAREEFGGATDAYHPAARHA
ncbi:MAG: HD superfamily phosphohydrolase [Chlamydiales bacterium]|jgi:HD superfamily phosphohydrolase